MNKKIKAIELASRVYQRKDIPKKVKYNAIEYNYSEEFCDYENQLGNYLFSIITLRAYWVNEEVEILEDEEEMNIQELEDVNLFDNGQNFNDMPIIIKSYDDNFTNINNTINKLVQAVKQLDKKINKED